MVKLIIVRHCETKGNLDKIFQGHLDTPISEKGMFQLGLLSARLKNEKIDAIYSSPQERALKTSNAINEFHGLKIKTHEGLKEIGMGDMEGMKLSSLPEIYPEQCENWNNKIHDFVAPNGEAMRDVFKRVGKTLDEIILKNPNSTVLICSHGCAIRNIMCYLQKIEFEKLAEVELGSNTCINIVEVDENQTKLIVSNDCNHLPKSMIMGKGQYKFQMKEGK